MTENYTLSSMKDTQRKRIFALTNRTGGQTNPTAFAHKCMVSLHHARPSVHFAEVATMVKDICPILVAQVLVDMLYLWRVAWLYKLYSHYRYNLSKSASMHEERIFACLVRWNVNGLSLINTHSKWLIPCTSGLAGQGIDWSVRSLKPQGQPPLAWACTCAKETRSLAVWSINEGAVKRQGYPLDQESPTCAQYL